jgi:hypothetical protein
MSPKNFCNLFCFVIVIFFFTVGFAFSSVENSKRLTHQYETNKLPVVIKLTDYILILQKNKGFIVDQKTGDSKDLESQTFSKLMKGPKLGVFQNKIIAYSLNNQSIFKLDLSKELRRSKEGLISWKLVIGCIFFIVCVLAFVYIRIYFYSQKRDVPIESTPTVHSENSLYQRIINSKKSLTLQELDVILEIDKLSHDSKKLKRHRLINELNSHFPGLITREKDLTDKRRNIYVVNAQQ